MKKQARLAPLLLVLAALGACENETSIKRRGPQSAVVPDEGALPPSGSVPTPGGASWDGLSDRPDAVWGF